MHSVASLTSIQERKEGMHIRTSFAYDTYTEMGMGRIMSISFFIYLSI